MTDLPPQSAPPAAPPDNRVRVAWTIAVAADFAQIVALPFFAEGALSPFNAVLDVAVGFALIRLLGWHWAFLPSFIAELLPGIDLIPTWSAAVLLATRSESPSAPAEKIEIKDVTPPKPRLDAGPPES